MTLLWVNVKRGVVKNSFNLIFDAELLEPFKKQRIYVLDSPRELGQSSPLYPFASGDQVFTEYLDLLLNKIHVDFVEIDNPVGSSTKTRHAVIATSKYKKVVIHLRAHSFDVDYLIKNVKEARNVAVFTSANSNDLKMSWEKHFSEVINALTYLLDSSLNVRFAVENFFVNSRNKKLRKKMFKLYKEAVYLGVHELDLPDTSGLSNPLEMYKLSRCLIETFRNEEVTIHIHSHASPGHEPLEKAVFALAAVLAAKKKACIHTTINGRAERGYIPSLVDVTVRLKELGAKTKINFKELLNLYPLYLKLFWWSPAFNGLHPPIWLDPSVNAHYSGTHYSKILMDSSDYDSNPFSKSSIKISHVSGKHVIASLTKKYSIKTDSKKASLKLREILSTREAFRYLSSNGELKELSLLEEITQES